MNLTLNSITFYILIVDDDKDDHFFLRRAINEKIPQAIVESLYDGSEALAYLDKCTDLPNVIFLDLNMSKISGQATIRVIRQNPHLKNVPVVILTTSKSEDERQALLRMGANEFYTKPYRADGLLEIVEQVCHKYLLPIYS